MSFGTELTKNIRWIGTLDPLLRVFDVVMSAEQGTTYNSYLVEGEDKTAIVELTKNVYVEEYLENLSNIVDIENIDYIVMNHFEPDHSSGIEEMMKIAPNAELLHSKPGKVFLKNLTNRDDINSRIVEEDTEIDLGGKTLRFIKAPFLHWPETMFTYIPEDKILFPCDFLGCHFCDDRLFDDRVSDFSYAFKYYYDILFRPFKEYALQALDKVDNLDIDIIAPSHGPILRTEPQKYLELYREWSQPRFDENNVLIIYASAYGNTRRLAKSIQKGLEESGMKVALFDITATEINRLVDELEESTGILIGSPTIQGDAVKPIWDFLSSLITIDYKGKYGASFGSYGWSGEAPDQILDRLRGLKFKTPLEPYKVKITPTDEEVDKAREFGIEFAKAIKD